MGRGQSDGFGQHVHFPGKIDQGVGPAFFAATPENDLDRRDDVDQLSLVERDGFDILPGLLLQRPDILGNLLDSQFDEFEFFDLGLHGSGFRKKVEALIKQ